jgi:hypothetical protein
MRYDESGAVIVDTAEPVEDDGARPVPPELQRATIDPETATLALIRAMANGTACAGTQHVFDGRRRYDLRFADKGNAALAPDSRSIYAGPSHLCEGTIDLIAGFPPEAKPGPEESTVLRFWLAPVLAGISPAPVLVEMSGKNGTIRSYLTKADTLEEAEFRLRAES